MKGTKQILSGLLALCMVMSMLPVQTFAEEEVLEETVVTTEAATEATEETVAETETATEPAEETTAPVETEPTPEETEPSMKADPEPTQETEAATEPTEEESVSEETEVEIFEENVSAEAMAATNSEIRTRMIQILYNGNGGYMSCDFDGYVNTSGRHEGIDFCASGGAGSSIYSLIAGVVTRVSNSNSLSTLAIYDEANNMTVIYLHGHYSLSTGERVSQGQYVGYESNLGASAAHTHIEVRSGKKHMHQ